MYEYNKQAQGKLIIVLLARIRNPKNLILIQNFVGIYFKMSENKKFDVIIYGASGCVGKFTVLQAVTVLKGLKWAIAGRSESKLQRILNEISHKMGETLTDIPILLADANNLIELEPVVENCKVLVNCCGPYHLMAEQILTTCILKGTHYVDMSNDPYFNESMELKYHERAMEHEVFVISSCGFYSLPLELALNFVQQQFQGNVNHVEAFVRYNFGYYFYYPFHAMWSNTAWLSLLNCSNKIADLRFIRQELRTVEMPILEPQLGIKELFQHAKYHGDGVMVHFPFLDEQAVERSQYQFYVRDGIRPIQFFKYMEFPSYMIAILFILWCLIVSILSQFTKTLKIMEKYPQLFSMGLFSSEGLNPYILEMTSYKLKLHAEGWSREQRQSNDNHNEMNIAMDIEIIGENPFYGCGCLCLLISARTLLEELNEMPGRGGVYSPGYAFRNTNILGRLQNFQNYYRINIL